MKKMAWVLGLMIGALLATGVAFAAWTPVSPDPGLLDPGAWCIDQDEVGCDAQPDGSGMALVPPLHLLRWSSLQYFPAGSYVVSVTLRADPAYSEVPFHVFLPGWPTAFCDVELTDTAWHTFTCPVTQPSTWGFRMALDARGHVIVDYYALEQDIQATATPTPSPTATGEPTHTPTPNVFIGLSDMLVTRTPEPGITITPDGPNYNEPMPTIAPASTATPLPQCLDPDRVRGMLFRKAVTETNSLFDGPRAWGIVMAASFDPAKSQSSGVEVGKNAGLFLGGLAAILTAIGVIVPVDVLLVVAIRLIVALIMFFIGLIGRVKTALKWW